MAIAYVNKGSFASGTGALTVGVPSGYTEGNFFLLMVESANQAITTPTNWTQVSNSPQYTGIAATAGAVRLAVFYKWVTSSESSVSVADSGNHTTAIISEWSGVNTVSPIDTTAGRVDSTATASISCPGVTTTTSNVMIVNVIGLDKDEEDTDTITSWANASLASITEGHDQTVTSGVGGGIAFAYGIKTSSGTVSATTGTGDSSTRHAYVTVALYPAPEIITGTATITGSESTTATAFLGVSATAALTGSATTTAAYTHTRTASATMAGTGTLTADGHSIRIAQATLTGAGSIAANGIAVPRTTTVVASLDPSKIFRVLDELVEGTAFIIGPTGTVEAFEFVEGSECSLSSTGVFTAVEFIEGSV